MPTSPASESPSATYVPPASSAPSELSVSETPRAVPPPPAAMPSATSTATATVQQVASAAIAASATLAPSHSADVVPGGEVPYAQPPTASDTPTGSAQPSVAGGLSVQSASTLATISAEVAAPPVDEHPRASLAETAAIGAAAAGALTVAVACIMAWFIVSLQRRRQSLLGAGLVRHWGVATIADEETADIVTYTISPKQSGGAAATTRRIHVFADAAIDWEARGGHITPSHSRDVAATPVVSSSPPATASGTRAHADTAVDTRDNPLFRPVLARVRTAGGRS